MKKIELHIHLDGSVEIDTIKKITNMTESEIKNKLIAKDKCNNLSEYLEKFELPIKCMQTKENLKLIAKELVDYLEKENVIYAEIRFAPMFHTNMGLKYEEIIDSVLEGLKTNNKVKTNLILCMMRGAKKIDNIHTIEVCEKYLNKGVCALDLAGAEDKYPLSDYINLFEIAKRKNIPFTIHAGENGNYNEVLLAIKLGAKRIGHGIHAIDDENTLNILKEKNILLEICPTSNVQTNSVDKFENHPIYKLYKKNVKVCINTDNKTVSNITLTEEYNKILDNFNLKEIDLINMNINAINASFLSSEEKQEILKKYLDS